MTTGKLMGSILSLVLLCTGCKEEDRTPAKTGISDLFLEYQVWGDEDRGEVNILLQLRRKNNKGKTVRMEPPGSVELDGEVLQSDSSGMTGVFYELQKPLDAFTGPHKITVRDKNEKQVTEEFDFTPFTLATPLASRVGRKNLVLKLSGIKNEDQVRVTLVDTVFHTDDINELVPVVNGRLRITPEQLAGVKAGPVTLLLYKEEERPIGDPAVRGGKIAITYGLTREFELVD